MATAVIVLIATPSSQGADRHLSERGLGPLEESELIEDSTRASTGGLMSSRPPEPAVSPRSERCPTARKGLAFYKARVRYWAHRMGAGPRNPEGARSPGMSCPRYLASLMRRKAHAARRAFERWHERHVHRLLEAEYAICFVFGDYCGQALRVAECESGKSRHAVNGQYLGIFQMGNYARSRYGHGGAFVVQARAAYHYFVASGRDWSPWSCKP